MVALAAAFEMSLSEAAASAIGGATSLNAIPTLFGSATTITLGIQNAPTFPPVGHRNGCRCMGQEAGLIGLTKLEESGGCIRPILGTIKHIGTTTLGRLGTRRGRTSLNRMKLDSDDRRWHVWIDQYLWP